MRRSQIFLASLSVPGYDLRDPKLSITPNGNIMVIIGGPDFIPLDDEHFVGGGRIDGNFTGLISFTRDGDFRNVLKLPSNSDSSYPGFVIEKGKLYISYYSSHETERTSIYFAELPISYFDNKK